MKAQPIPTVPRAVAVLLLVTASCDVAKETTRSRTGAMTNPDLTYPPHRDGAPSYWLIWAQDPTRATRWARCGAAAIADNSLLTAEHCLDFGGALASAVIALDYAALHAELARGTTIADIAENRGGARGRVTHASARWWGTGGGTADVAIVTFHDVSGGRPFVQQRALWCDPPRAGEEAQLFGNQTDMIKKTAFRDIDAVGEWISFVSRSQTVANLRGGDSGSHLLTWAQDSCDNNKAKNAISGVLHKAGQLGGFQFRWQNPLYGNDYTNLAHATHRAAVRHVFDRARAANGGADPTVPIFPCPQAQANACPVGGESTSLATSICCTDASDPCGWATDGICNGRGECAWGEDEACDPGNGACCSSSTDTCGWADDGLCEAPEGCLWGVDRDCHEGNGPDPCNPVPDGVCTTLCEPGPDPDCTSACCGDPADPCGWFGDGICDLGCAWGADTDCSMAPDPETCPDPSPGASLVCGDDPGGIDADAGPADAGPADAGPTPDAGAADDAGSPPGPGPGIDAGRPGDAGPPIDAAGPQDAAPALDAANEPDAGTPADAAGAPDGGETDPTDGGVIEAPLPDP